MNMKRRTFLKGTMAAGVVSVATAAGLLAPSSVLASWPKDAFNAKSMDSAMSGLLGTTSASDSSGIKIKAPDIAENGAVVPVTVSTKMSGVESISIFVSQNGTPLAASFDMSARAEGNVSVRVKMGKTSNVVAVVKADGKLYQASKEVKVTIGGCGG